MTLTPLLGKHRDPRCLFVFFMLASSGLAYPQQLASGGDPTGCNAPLAEITVPSGVDTQRLRAIDQGKPSKVYVDVLRFGDEKEDKAIFPPEMASRTEFSKAGLTRVLADTMLSARRFEVYDMAGATALEQTGVIIDARIIEAPLSFRRIEGDRRRAQVRVTMSVQMKDTTNGKNLLPSAVMVEGKTGLATGDGTVIGVMDTENSPTVIRQLTKDFHDGLRRAFREASYRIGDLLRPMARLMDVEGCDAGFFGGSRFGIQAKDEMVVFRPRMMQLGDQEVLASTRAVARVRCDSVGTDNAQCKIVAQVKGYQPQPKDFGIVTDESMRRSRQE